MSDADTDAAVAAALSSDWKRAATINRSILARNPKDIDCLNRLGKALLELGETKKAATVFRQVLKISKYDQIARRNLARVLSTKSLKRGRVTTRSAPGPISPGSFLEEPGKTRLVSLVNVGEADVLFRQNYGNRVDLVTKKHTVLVFDRLGNYLGALPDDLAHRLYILIKGGNVYDGLVKSASKNSINIFIREVKRGRRYANTPSFPVVNNDYLTYLREEAMPQEADRTKAPASETDGDDDGKRVIDDEEDEEE